LVLWGLAGAGDPVLEEEALEGLVGDVIGVDEGLGEVDRAEVSGQLQQDGGGLVLARLPLLQVGRAQGRPDVLVALLRAPVVVEPVRDRPSQP